MSRLTYPSDLFHLRDGEQPIYGTLPDVKVAVDFFKGLMAPGEWELRRAAIAQTFYEMLIGEGEDPTGKGSFFKPNDLFGWYLFLGESFNEHPWNYEIIYGCRVIPILIAIGRQLDMLKAIVGFNDRALRLIGSARSQPNGLLFEMLVAAAYANAGGQVTFRKETPGQGKSHDLDVELNGAHWAVECKRMEAGEYGESERQRMRTLWVPASLLPFPDRRSIIADLDFKIELEDVPDEYLLSRVRRFLRRSVTYHMWSDDVMLGSIGGLDLEPIKLALTEDVLLHPSPQYTKLLTGSYRGATDSALAVQRVQYASNPHYIKDIDWAVVARWRSLSEVSLNKKARDILRSLADANDQLPDNVAGIIHIGFEALGSDEIELRRYEKIIQTVHDFDRGKSRLAFIYCYYFAPDASPEEIWAINETDVWFGTSELNRPLKTGRLLPSDDGGRPGVHWKT